MSIQTDPTLTHTSVLHTNLSIQPPNIVSARGNYLYTKDGIALLDASGGAAVSCIGCARLPISILGISVA